MFERDNEAEGTFGDFKENVSYDRLYRRGHENVQMEIYLVAIGHNTRNWRRESRKQKKRIKETEEENQGNRRKTDETGQGDAQIIYLLIKFF